MTPVAGTESAVLMVESEAKELSEDQMLGAVLFGHDEMQIAFKRSMNLQLPLVRNHLTGCSAHNEELRAKLKEAFEAKISKLIPLQ